MTEILTFLRILITDLPFFTDVLCCTGIVASDWPFIRTIQTINLKSLRIDRNRRPMIGNAGITKCDVMATNGVVHEINDVIVIKESRRPPLFF